MAANGLMILLKWIQIVDFSAHVTLMDNLEKW